MTLTATALIRPRQVMPTVACVLLLLASQPIPTLASEAGEADDQGADREKLPLLYAAGEGDAEEVERLLQAGADVMERSPHMETPLHVAGIKGDIRTVRLLLDAGADPNARTAGGQYLKMPPLAWYVYGGHSEGVEALIDAGADVNARNTKGQTALDMALGVGREELVSLLKRGGAKEGKDIEAANPHEEL